MLRSRVTATIAALVALVALVALAPAAAAAKPDPTERLQRALDGLVDARGGPPGASAVIQRRGNQTLVSSGVADLDTGKPFRRNLRMRIASVSKAFSGAVGLSLADQGLLSLDDSIRVLLPSLPEAWQPVTLRTLLNHTSGLPNYTTDPGFQQYFTENLQGQITIRQLVDFVTGQPLRFEPGTEYAYSNTDNLVVALLAEAATGKSYEALLSELVSEPLGLDRTYLPSGTRFPEPRIHGYELFPTEDITECCSMAFVSASGGIVSTPSELTRFISGYGGGELFGATTRAQQFGFVEGGGSEPPGPGANSAGLGIFRYETRCGTVFGHTGNFPGYTQFTATTRSGRKALTVSANRQLAPDAVGERAPQVFKKLRRADEAAVCALLE